MTKKIIRVLSIVLMISCMVMSVSAAVVPPVEPNWDNVSRLSCRITFSGTRGTVFCDISARTGTTSITGTLTLYEDDVEIDSWDIDVETSYVTIADNFTGDSGSTYKLVLDADVVTNGVSEPLDYTATKVCP